MIPSAGRSGDISGGTLRGAVHLRNLDQWKKKEVNRNYIKKFFGGLLAQANRDKKI